MCECTCPDEGDDEGFAEDGTCTHWKPVEIAVCLKHQQEYRIVTGCCPICDDDAFEAMYRFVGFLIEHGHDPVYPDD
jgi:hypothetical protein